MSCRREINYWLYSNHNKYESAGKWRKALIGFILRSIDKAKNDECVRIMTKLYELDKPGAVINFSDLRKKINS